MAWRVTEDDVREIIDTNAQISVVPFLDMANALTDYVVAQDSDSVLTASLLAGIEKNLAAHFYAARDQLYASKITERAEAIFQGQFGKRLESTDYGQRALVLDVTGTLDRLNRGPKKASLTWLGKPVSDQTDYEDRD